MGRYNSASEGHRFSTRIARRIAEKAARQLEQQSEKQAAHAEKKAQAKKAARKLVQQVGACRRRAGATGRAGVCVRVVTCVFVCAGSGTDR